MYWIREKLDGSFDCSYRIQDGTEYFTEPSMSLAISKMVQAARFMNGGVITKDDISFSVEREVHRPASTEVVVDRVPPPKSRPIDYEIPGVKYPGGLKGLLLRIADSL